MAKYVGLDWAGKGWFGVVLRDDPEDGEEPYETEVFPSILSVWHKHDDAERIFIDIPIGLPEKGRRQCDTDAAEMLEDRRSSVFPTPCRGAVYATTLKEAKRVNKETIGDSISNQAWAIVPRIREVDEFLREVDGAQGTVREVHPEVCFWAFGGERAMADGKKTKEGREKRLEVLGRVDDRADEIYEDAVGTHIDPPAHARTLSKNAKDDIVDALAVALTAQGGDDQLATIPDDPPTDEEGLPMEMVYRVA